VISCYDYNKFMIVKYFLSADPYMSAEINIDLNSYNFFIIHINLHFVTSVCMHREMWVCAGRFMHTYCDNPILQYMI